MNSEKKSIQEWVHTYQNGFLPYKKEALQIIAQKNEEILTGLVNAIHEAIPEGKWKIFFENTFWFLPPVDTKNLQDKRNERRSIYWMLQERIQPAAGIYFVCFDKKDKETALSAGFTSWKDFHDSLPELNNALKDIVGFWALSYDDVSEQDENFKVSFDTTI